MSEQTSPLNNGQQAIIHTDTSKIFIWGNRYKDFIYTNSTGAPVTLTPGLVMGRIAATGKIIPLVSSAVDGSQFPVGIVNQKRVVADAETVTVSLCISGDVAREKVTFSTGDTLDTVIKAADVPDLSFVLADTTAGGTTLTIVGLKTVVAIIDAAGLDVTNDATSITYGVANTVIVMTGLAATGTWKIKFAGYTNDSRTIEDMIMGGTLGINLVPGTEMTAYDNE